MVWRKLWMLAAEFQGCVTQNISLSEQYSRYARWTYERGVNYNAKVAHFVHRVNRLVINTVMNVTRVDITHIDR